MSSNLEYPKVCALCGAHFLAKKLSTQYCSHKCSQRAYKQKLRDDKMTIAVDEVKEKSKPLILQQKKSQISKLSQTPTTILNEKEILNIAQAAILMGIGRSTIHRYCVEGKLKCIKMNRKVFIRRKDIDGIFEYAQRYQVTPRPKVTKSKAVKPKDKPPQRVAVEVSQPVEVRGESISDFYTSAEAAKRYNVSKSTIIKRVVAHKVPKIVYQGKTLYCKQHIDELFAPKIAVDGVERWYTVEEIKKIYSMSTSAVYSLASDNQVPRQNDRGKTLYSKEHIDELLSHRLEYSHITEWYSMEDIFDKYGLRPGYVANFVYKNNIPRKRIGGNGYYAKKLFDAAVKEKQPAGLLMTMQDAAEMYGMTYEQISWIVRNNNLKKVKQGKFMKICQSELERIINPPKIYSNGNK